MNAGKLNKRAVIKRSNKTDDGYGGWTSEIVDVAEVWCDFKETESVVSDANGSVNNLIGADLVMRKKTAENIQIGDTLMVYGSVTLWRINSVMDSVNDFFTTFKCSRIG